MPIVAHEYLMSLTVLSANTKCCAVPIAADRADFVPGPQLQNGTEYELQTFTVTSSLRDATYGHLRYKKKQLKHVTKET